MPFYQTDENSFFINFLFKLVMENYAKMSLQSKYNKNKSLMAASLKNQSISNQLSNNEMRGRQHMFTSTEQNMEILKQESTSRHASAQLKLILQRRQRIKCSIKQQDYVKQPASKKNLKTVDSLGMRKIVNITDLIKLFFEKLTYNNTQRQPVQYNPQTDQFNQQDEIFCSILKIHIPQIAENIMVIIKIIYIIIFFFTFPLSLLYNEVNYSQFNEILKITGIFLSLFDILQNCQSTYLKDISSDITKQKLVQIISSKKISIMTQIFIVIMTLLSIIIIQYDSCISVYLFLPMVINIKTYFSQITKLEDKFFTATHYEKYWDLFKVLSMNLLVCHLIACILISITYIQADNSWMVNNKINLSSWYEQYIWSYYFGTTIILTIGFGDLHPANYYQAFIIIFISFFACVFFGYNINYIGNLINSIRQDQIEKNNKLKVFNTLAKRSKVSKGTLSQISNYIIEQSKIKQRSNYAQEKQLIQQLPQTLRSTFLHQANHKLFNHLKDIIPLRNKTIEKLSLKIEAKICHPDQLIKKMNQSLSLIILQSGEVGYIARKAGSRLTNMVIQRIKCDLEQQSKIICADIFSNNSLKYDIKSLAYSIIYQINKHTFQECLGQSKQDYQIYRQIIDKCKYKIDQFGLVKCRFCDNKNHTLFQCPRLHFQPFKSNIPFKNIKKKEEENQTRVKFTRHKNYLNVEYINENPTHAEISIDDIMSNNSMKHFNSNYVPRAQKRKEIKINSQGESFIINKMVTQIRQDISNLKKENFGQFEFTLWNNIDCDEASNYKYYFHKSNPDFIGKKAFKQSILNWSKNIKKKVTKKQITHQ